MRPLRSAAVLSLLLCLCVGSAHAYGDRPGQVRDVMFSSLGRHGKKYSNDPRMWPAKYKKSKEETDKLTYHYLLPGSREAMKLHETDVSLKAMKRAKRSRSLSVRTRSASSGRSTSRKDSVSALALKNREKLLQFLDLESHTKFTLLRVLRMGHMTKKDLTPKGPWTAKSRPPSLLPDECQRRKIIERKQKLAHTRKSKRLKGAGKQAAKAAGRRSGSSKKRSVSVKPK